MILFQKDTSFPFTTISLLQIRYLRELFKKVTLGNKKIIL